MKKISILLSFVVLLGMISSSAQNEAQVLKKQPELQRAFIPQPSSIPLELTNINFYRGVNSDMYFGYGSNTTFYKSTLATFPASTMLGSPGFNVQATEYIGGVYYAVTYEGTSNRFGTINTTNGSYTNIKSSFANDAVSMCYNPANGLTYVFAWGSSTSSPFGTVNLETGAYTPIGNVPGIFYAAIDNEGICYAIHLRSSGTVQFGNINLSTGAFTSIANIPFNTNYVQSMCVDRETNKLYWLAVNFSASTQHLYEINKQTGALVPLATPDFTANASAFGIDSEILANYCDPISSLSYTTSGDVVVLNWVSAPGNPIGYRITFDGEVLEQSFNGNTYTHTNVPPKLHTYAVAALYDSECIPTEESVQVIVGDFCMLRVEMQVLEAHDPDYPEIPTWGWDGSHIEIICDGNTYGTPRVPHASLSATEYILVPSGQIAFRWVNGDIGGEGYGEFDHEITFQIYNSDNESIFTCNMGDAANWGAYETFFTYENDCALEVMCDPVVVEAAIQENSILVTWSEPTTEGTLNLWRNGAKIVEDISGVSYRDENPISGNNCYKIEFICEEGFVFSNEPCVNFIGIIETDKTGFSIAPNPATDKISITAASNFSKVEIVNFLGQTVFSQTTDKNSTTIDVANLHSGIYFVRIVSENGSHVQKFVKQ